MKVSIVTFDDFTDLDLFILWDLLNRVEDPEWIVKLLGDQAKHVSSTGIEVQMHGRLEEANSSDAVLFCSGKGTLKKFQDKEFLKAFSLDESKQLIGSIDSGALLMGALGLLKGKTATTYPRADIKELLESMGAKIVWESFVRDGNVATAAQCLSGQYLAGWVIESLVGVDQKERALNSVAPLELVQVNL
jgi:transcriptional regulator GlxA family with amidase domain